MNMNENERPSAERGQTRTFHTIQPGDVTSILRSSTIKAIDLRTLKFSDSFFFKRSKIFVGSLVPSVKWIHARFFL